MCVPPLSHQCLREYGRVDGGLDDAGVDSQDGENDAGQKHQCQLVDILDADEHHRSHGGQQDGPVHTHVVQQGSLCLGTFQALQGKDGCFGRYVDLKDRGLSYYVLFFGFWPIYPGKTLQNFSNKSSIHAYCSPRASRRYLFRECYSSTFLTHLPSLSGDLNWQISGHKPPPPALLLLLLNSINSPWAKRKKKGRKTIKEGEKSVR